MSDDIKPKITEKDQKDQKETEETENKPNEESDDKNIMIKVVDMDGESTVFRIRKTTKMRKLFENYAKRHGKDVNTLRFLLDGVRVSPDQTPEELEIEDMDQLDCVLEQQGGGDFN